MVRVARVRRVPERWLGLALVSVCFAACTRRVDIVGEAMAPTLKNGESAITTPALGRLERGDIVGFKYPRDASKSFVLRIIGLPGERIEMTNGQVAIDGRRLDEKYVVEANRSSNTGGPSDTWGPITIPAGEYFVMGDNRRNSFDSRSWGTVRRDLIWAKVLDAQK